MNKKYLLISIGIGIAIIGISLWFIYNPKSLNVGATVFSPLQGGTGIGSAVAGDVGKFLKVSNNSPLTYILDSVGSSFSGLLMGEGSTTKTHIDTLTFSPSSFDFSPTASSGLLTLDYTNGPASRSLSQTWTGTPYFSVGASFSGTTKFTSLYDSASNNVMTLKSGNVGIGDSSPEQKLTVNTGSNGAILASGSSNVDLILKSTSATGAATEGQFTIRSAGSSERLDILNNTTNLVTIASTGNVGIGTTGPGQKLDVNGNITVEGKTIYGDVATSWLALDSTNGSYLNANGSYFRVLPASDLIFVANNSEKMRIVQSTGNVGIGTTGPDNLLDVYTTTAGQGAHLGNAYVGIWDANNAYAVFAHNNVKATTGSYALTQGSTGATTLNSSAGNNLLFRIGNADKMILDSTGNVGIGNTTPDQKLDVAGNITASTSGNRGITAYFKICRN